MAASKDVMCNICEAHSVNTSALKWCSECDEAFCPGCLKFHATAKATRDHDVIDVGDFKQLPEIVLDITQYCKEHGAAFQNFCIDHDCPCCRKCINTTHKTCKELPALDDVIGNARSSVVLQNLEEHLSLRNKFLSDLAEEKNNNVDAVKKEANVILSDIRRRREETNAQLDVIEKETKQILDVTICKTVKNLEDQKRKIEEKEKVTSDLIDSVEKLKKHGSNLQVFLGIREFEKSAMKEELFIENEEQNKLLFSNAKMAYKGSMPIVDIKSFGDISIEFTDSLVDMSGIRRKSAQIAEIPPKNIENLQLKPGKKVGGTLDSWNCHGCTILPNGKLLLADYDNNRLVFFDKNGLFETAMLLNYHPYDVTDLNNNNLVVVTTWSKRILIIIDWQKKVIKEKIEINSWCGGIAVASQKLVVSTSAGIVLVDLEQKYKIHHLNIGSKSADEYVDVNGNYIYYGYGNSVSCADFRGNIQWTFRNQILVGARGIKVNKLGMVFVACQTLGTIVAISSCGTKYKVFSIDLVKEPRTLCFDKDDENKLLICGWNNDSAFYSCSYLDN